MTRRDPDSWTVVRLPERDLGEVVLELAAPLLERLGPSPAVDDARAALDLSVTFWNASVLASKRWEYRRVKELNALKKRMREPTASREDAATFDLLTERWREHWLDPRLVERWTYESDAAGVPRLVCTMGLPEGVRAEAPAPPEKRVAIGGNFLDESRRIPSHFEPGRKLRHGPELPGNDLRRLECAHVRARGIHVDGRNRAGAF